MFIPGAAHLARVAYGGHDGHRPWDFLSYWLNHAGHDFLGISYPLETTPPIVEPSFPSFSIPQWGQTAAEMTQRVARENRLGCDVILLGWSMGGKVLKPFMRSAVQLGLEVKLFISLAATPGGITGLRAYPAQVRPSETGYAQTPGMVQSFVRQLHDQESLNDSTTIIDPDTYSREYLGNTPVRLTTWGLTYESRDGFISDEWEGIRDGGPQTEDYQIYPWIGIIHPTSTSDFRHTLADPAVWGMALTNKLVSGIPFGRFSSDSEGWDRLKELINSAPGQMTKSVEGGHLFFVGAKGAKKTTDAILALVDRQMALQSTLSALLRS